MTYIPIALNHFRALQRCAEAAGIKVTMDCGDFCLEAKGRGRYYTLYPQFSLRKNGRIHYTQQLTDEYAAFIGWLPYRPVSYEMICDKLHFKRLMSSHGRMTPRLVRNLACVEHPFLKKHSTGSFGHGLDGPYPAGHELRPEVLAPLDHTIRGSAFTEEFVLGSILKVWLWGRRPVFAHHHEYPRVVGTGSKSVSDLLKERLTQVGENFSGQGDQRAITLSLAFQGVSLEDVLPAGRTIWIDYRYGRSYTPASPTSISDTAWYSLPDAVRVEATKMGELIGSHLERHFGSPILCSVDGVVDGNGTVWWLEANTNPMVPPDVYGDVFSTLFGSTSETAGAVVVSPTGQRSADVGGVESSLSGALHSLH